MSTKTGIEWADHTFNPWWGCEKVSEACRSCYAETFANRFPRSRGLWGPDSERKVASEKVWGDPIRWNEAARRAGVRRRVFCASMADVFEDRRELDKHRGRLWKLIEATPSLDWLLLTKRPENFEKLTPWRWLDGGIPKNVWAGTTVENQARAEERIPRLLEIPARVRFLSCEPLLGEIDLSAWLGSMTHPDPKRWWVPEVGEPDFVPGIHWVIVGGESGSDARPMHPEWARLLRHECQAARVPFFFKQWGEWRPKLAKVAGEPAPVASADREWGTLNARGEFFATATPWNGRQLDDSGDGAECLVVKVGKKSGGAILDGREWCEVPT